MAKEEILDLRTYISVTGSVEKNTLHVAGCIEDTYHLLHL
jgi:hypothetical protein